VAVEQERLLHLVERIELSAMDHRGHAGIVAVYWLRRDRQFAGPSVIKEPAGPGFLDELGRADEPVVEDDSALVEAVVADHPIAVDHGALADARAIIETRPITEQAAL
jgi:hypothetical protein